MANSGGPQSSTENAIKIAASTSTSAASSRGLFWPDRVVTLVVYYLHEKTGWSTVCTNGKQKSPMKNFDLDWSVPFAQPPLNDT